MPAKIQFHPLCVTSCLMLLFTAAPNLVLGQQTALEEISVTAQKREQGINDVGITVNAFTAAQLENYGVRSAEHLEAITPGLTVTNAQPHGVPVYTIRGIGFEDYTTSASSTVGLYFDEVNLPYAVMTRGVLFDVERVEVLKGPQDDLYGRNTTAGQINFISRKPTEEFAGGIKLGYSRFDVIDAEAYLSGPLTDNARARVAVKTTQSAGDGWQKSLSRPGDRLGEYDDIAVRGLLDLDINDNASLFINLHWYEDNSDNMAPTPIDGTAIGQPTSLALPTPGNIIFSEGKSRAADWSPDLPPERNNTLKGASAKLDWDFGGVNLTTITSYDKFDRSETFDPSGVGFEDADVLNTTDLEIFSQEIRLSSDNDSNLYWLVGAHYSWDDMSESYILFMDESFFAFFGNPPGLDIDTAYEQTTEAFAGFAHIEYEFATDFRLTLGARYTDEEREWSGCTYDTGDGSLGMLWNFILTPFVMIPQGFPDPGPLGPGGCGIYDERAGSPTFGQLTVFSDEISTDKWMWKATLDYSPMEDVLIYGTVSEGFKSGGFNGAAAQTHTQLLPYKAETLLAFEAGIKSVLFDGRLQLNLAGFYYDYEDKQEPTVAVTPVGNISGLTNVPESESVGVEMEAHWLVSTGLTLDLGVAWLNTEIKEYDAVDELASAWANSRALAVAGVAANTPNPEGGIIERGSNGEPTGILRESAIMLVRMHVPPHSAEMLRKALKWSLDQMLSHGITSFTEASTGFVAGMEREVALYTEMADAGLLRQRARLCLNWEPGNTELEAIITERNLYARDYVATDCIKIFLDGVPTDSHTAAMLEPYALPMEGRDDEASRYGMLLVDQDVLDEAVIRFDRMGLTVKFHAAGDAAVRAGLDAFEAARKANGFSGQLHDVGLCTFVSREDLPRARALGATFEVSPYLWSPSPINDDIAKEVGEERTRRVWPVREMLDANALVVAGSDWAVVPSVNPWIAVEALVTRELPGGSTTSFGKEQAISLDEAIRLFTVNSAKHLGMADRLGRIEPGLLADLIVLDRDPFGIPVTELHKVRVEKTMVNGDLVFEANDN